MGASNELPESEELDALYDRFLVRREVKQVSQAGLYDLLRTPDTSPNAAPTTSDGAPPLYLLLSIMSLLLRARPMPAVALCLMRISLACDCSTPS